MIGQNVENGDMDDLGANNFSQQSGLSTKESYDWSVTA